MSLREQIMSASAFEAETVDVPAWGVSVQVRSMSLAEKTAIQKRSADGDGHDLEKLLPGIVVACCFDPETGERLFSDGDVDWLLGQPAGTIETLAEVGIRISGLGDKAVDAAKKGS